MRRGLYANTVIIPQRDTSMNCAVIVAEYCSAISMSETRGAGWNEISNSRHWFIERIRRTSAGDEIRSCRWTSSFVERRNREFLRCSLWPVSEGNEFPEESRNFRSFPTTLNPIHRTENLEATNLSSVRETMKLLFPVHEEILILRVKISLETFERNSKMIIRESRLLKFEESRNMGKF